MKKTVIKNGRVVDPKHGIDKITHVFIQDSKIAAVADDLPGFESATVVDATGLVVCPGLVDLCAQGMQTAREAQAAAKGGITTICAPLTEMTSQAGYKLYPIAALQDAGQLNPMGLLKDKGIIGVGNHSVSVENTELLRHCFDYAASFDMPVYITPKDAFLSHHGVAHEGVVSTRLGLAGISPAQETIDVARCIELAIITGARVHFQKITTTRALDLIGQAKQQSIQVTCDTTIHHLYLTEIDTRDYDSNCYIKPPLRSERDKLSLRTGLLEQVIDAVCSDHRPCTKDEKRMPFSEVSQGMSGVEMLLPLLLRMTQEQQASLSAILSKVTAEPAAIAGLNAGHLGEEAPADICIFDPDGAWEVTEASIYSAGKNTPFMGYGFLGRVCYTLIDGTIVHEEKSS